MLTMAIVAFIALVAPYLIWSRYQKGKVTVYQGPATVLQTPLLGSSAVDKDYDFLHVEVPGRESMLLRVSRERLSKLSGLVSNVQIVISKLPFGKPFIESVQWPGESSFESEEDNFKGLGLSGTYLMLALGSVAAIGYLSIAGAPLTLVGHVALYYSALLLAMSGYVMGRYMQKAPERSKLSAKFLFISLGSGLTSLYLLFAVCALLTAVSFWWFSFLILIPGLNAAMALGGLVATLQKLR